MGSKAKYAAELLPLILKDRQPDQCFVDLFCGSCSIVCKVPGPRIANDNNIYLIEMWRAIQSGWIPPQHVSEIEYRSIQQNKEIYPNYLVGYVGFNLSYAGKWWGGYARDKAGKRDYGAEAFRNVTKQIPLLTDIEFFNLDYKNVPIPQNSIIFCDPPYANTTRYKTAFDHLDFWDWIRRISQEHQVFVTEYTAPPDFKCIWSKKVNNSLTQNTGSKQGIESLWVL